MKLLRLTAENIMRLKAVDFRLEGKSLVIGGENDAGKSTALQLVQMLMGGAKDLPSTPLRRGAKKGEIVGETETLIAKRRFTASGGTAFEITSKENGEKLRSPQAIADKLLGPMFDPADFLRSDPGKQVEIVRRLTGLDFTAHDLAREDVYNERADANRDVKQLRARLDSAPHSNDAPEVETSVAELAAELTRRQEINRENEEKRAELRKVADEYRAAQAIAKKAESDLVAAKAEFVKTSTRGRTLKAEVGQLKNADTVAVQATLSTVDDANRRVRENLEYAKLTDDHKAAEVSAKDLQRQIDDLDEKKAEAIAAAEYPIDGLGVDDAGLTFEGLPLDQAGQASQLRCAIAIGIAVSPDFPVLAIRHGSEFSDTTLAKVLADAEDIGAQLLIERVGDGKECSVIIEDGEVRS